MSKRKNRSAAPNIPQETLERARRQAAGENVDAEAPKDFKYGTETAPTTRAERRAETGTAVRKPPTPVTLTAASYPTSRLRGQRNHDELTVAEIDERLNNPDRTVSLGELQKEYGYVVADIRNMGILSLALFAFLIAAGLVLG
jgi:hypothetical protein